MLLFVIDIFKNVREQKMLGNKKTNTFFYLKAGIRIRLGVLI